MQVLNQIIKNLSAASIAALLFDLREAAQSENSGATRFFLRHPLRNVFAGLLLDMLAKLISHFSVGALGMEERAHSQRQGIEQLCDVHIQASFSRTMPEMAVETRFQLAVSFSSCLRPNPVNE